MFVKSEVLLYSIIFANKVEPMEEFAQSGRPNALPANVRLVCKDLPVINTLAYWF